MSHSESYSIEELVKLLMQVALIENELGFSHDEAISLGAATRIDVAMRQQGMRLKEVAALFERSNRCIQQLKAKASLDSITKGFEEQNRKSKYVRIMEVVPKGRPMTIGDIAKVLKWDEDTVQAFVRGGERRGYLKKVPGTKPVQYEHTGAAHVRPEPRNQNERMSRGERALRILTNVQAGYLPLTYEFELPSAGVQLIENYLRADNADEATFVVATRRDRESTDRLPAQQSAAETFGLAITFGKMELPVSPQEHARRCVLGYVSGSEEIVLATTAYFDPQAVGDFFSTDLQYINNVLATLLAEAQSMEGERQTYRLTMSYSCIAAATSQSTEDAWNLKELGKGSHEELITGHINCGCDRLSAIN